MYKGLCKDIPGFTHPGHGYLAGWAEQGNNFIRGLCVYLRYMKISKISKVSEKYKKIIALHTRLQIDQRR